MEFKYFSRNGQILPIEQATVPLSNIEYQYGFGVYESIRVVAGNPQFLDEHVERLLESAKVIGLQHSFTQVLVRESVEQLLEKNAVESCNIKILLLGGTKPILDILCLNPLFLDRKLYRDGVHTVTYQYERAFPHAKTLNMLQSYLAYQKAKRADAYDALLTDQEGNIVEGTRTNFLCVKGKILISPSEEKILLGVARKHVLEVAHKIGFSVEFADVKPADLSRYEAAFLTSTSSKILPIHAVDDFEFGEQPAALKELMNAFDRFLDTRGGEM